MNYKADPFQNYELITVDELKDQANSLLNLVTEEQQPLRIFLNNDQEFLLFPQDLLTPICDSDLRLILLSAETHACPWWSPIISSVIFSFWMISFSYWLPMISGGTLKTMQSMSQIRIFGRVF